MEGQTQDLRAEADSVALEAALGPAPILVRPFLATEQVFQVQVVSEFRGDAVVRAIRSKTRLRAHTYHPIAARMRITE